MIRQLEGLYLRTPLGLQVGLIFIPMRTTHQRIGSIQLGCKASRQVSHFGKLNFPRSRSLHYWPSMDRVWFESSSRIKSPMLSQTKSFQILLPNRGFPPATSPQ